MTRTKINWKRHGDLLFYGYYRGVMVWKLLGAHGSAYWTDTAPAIQYGSETELINFLNTKHRA